MQTTPRQNAVCLWTVVIVSGKYRNCPDSFNTVQTVSILSGRFQYFPDGLDTVQTLSILSTRISILSGSPGQVWVINSNLFLQLNLWVCYRENQFGIMVGPGRALLTLARSHICPVNKFVRKKSSLILAIVTGTFNRPVRWFINSMLPEWTSTLGGCKDCRPYSHRKVEKVAGGIFFTSFYD